MEISKMKVSKVKGAKLKVSKNYANGEAMLIDLISITMVEIKARMNYLVEKYPECFDDSDMQRILECLYDYLDCSISKLLPYPNIRVKANKGYPFICKAITQNVIKREFAVAVLERCLEKLGVKTKRISGDFGNETFIFLYLQVM